MGQDMYDEPHKEDLNYEAYWSSRPLDELLKKAQEAVEKTYSGSMTTLSFLSKSLDHMEVGSEIGADTADAMKKASRINRMLAELRQDISKLVQEENERDS